MLQFVFLIVMLLTANHRQHKGPHMLTCIPFTNIEIKKLVVIRMCNFQQLILSHLSYPKVDNFNKLMYGLVEYLVLSDRQKD